MGRIGHGDGSERISCDTSAAIGIFSTGLSGRRRVAAVWSGSTLDSIQTILGMIRDGGWKGLDFLKEDSVLQDSWRDYWPQGAGNHNWDAVARASSGGKTEWILSYLEEKIQTVFLPVTRR